MLLPKKIISLKDRINKFHCPLKVQGHYNEILQLLYTGINMGYVKTKYVSMPWGPHEHPRGVYFY